jgi:hypothetical protein
MAAWLSIAHVREVAMIDLSYTIRHLSRMSVALALLILPSSLPTLADYRPPFPTPALDLPQMPSASGRNLKDVHVRREFNDEMHAFVLLMDAAAVVRFHYYNYISYQIEPYDPVPRAPFAGDYGFFMLLHQ